jgi:MoxR-like ATPase
MRYELRLPDGEEYRRTIAAVVESLAAERRAHVDLVPADYDDVAATLTGLTLNQARQAIARVAIEDGRLSRDDLARLVHLKAEALRDEGLLEYFPPADNPHELGGFAGLQRWLARASVAFTARAAELNLAPPRGVLLVGVQGCGKSLAAKVIARQWGKPLLKLDAGRLYDKYVGESEKNFRRAIATAEAMAPVVLWIDEIEKGLAPSGGGDADGGLSRRLFGSFLTWMQEKRKDVFVVATANDLQIIPPEMLRKGRFDEIFFVDLPDPAEREEILRIHLRLRKQDPGTFDLAPVVEASDGFSGAELEQAVIASLLRALQEDRPLDAALLIEEIRATVPLSRSRYEDVARLRAFAADRFVPVG